MSEGWARLAWRALPVLLLLAWFLGLIGGVSLGGLVHLLLLGAIVVFAYQTMGDAST